VTANGRKIGKSLGNAVDPVDLVARYGVDALRWWLLREVPRVGEADFTEARLVEAANRDLANGVGNLVQRVVGLGGGFASGRRSPRTRLHDAVDTAIAAFDLRAAAGEISAEIDAVNREIEVTRPWSLIGSARERVVTGLSEATATIVEELQPFVPDLAARAAARLTGGSGSVPYARLAPVPLS
jgi:methionyl-tRNA synthetase